MSARGLMIELAEQSIFGTLVGASSPSRIHRMRLEGRPICAPGSVIARLPSEKRAVLRELKSDDIANVRFTGDIFSADERGETEHRAMLERFDRTLRLRG